MKDVSSRLLRQSSIYALGNVVLKASGLVLAVLYLNPAYLSVEGFGYFGLLMVTAQFGLFVVGLGIGSGLLKFLTDPAYAADHPALPFTALGATVAASVVAAAAFWLLAEPVAALMLDDPARAVLVRLLGGYVAFKVIGAIPMMLLRVEERAGWYVAVMVAEVLVLLGAAYVLMVEYGQGVTGLMGAYTLAAGVSAVVLVGVMLVHVPWRYEQRLVRVLIRFGVPLVMASLAGWFLNAGDRYLLKWLADAATVGLYEWAARMAGVLNMLFVQSFNLAFAVVGLKTLGVKGADATIHRETLRHYVVWTGWVALGLSLLAYDLTRLLPADAAYLQADRLVLLLALGFVSYGIYYVIINVVYASGRTKAIGVNIVAAAVLNAVLNLLLIPLIGALGAALATFLAYFALALGAAYFARRDVALGFPWGVFLAVVGVASVLYALGLPGTAWALVPRLAARLGLILAYPLLMMAMGVYSRDDVQRARAVLRRLLPGADPGASPGTG